MNLLKLFFPILLIVFSFQTFAKIEIDLLVYHSKDVDPSDVEPLVNVANTVYGNSRLAIHLRVVKYQEVDLTNTTLYLSDLQQAKKPFQDVKKLREKYGADMVTVISKFNGEYGTDHCGQSSTPSSESDLKGHQKYYFTTSAAPLDSPGDLSLVHVLGHNMGLMHSPNQRGVGAAIYKYARGWGIDKQFHTVMALGKDYNTDYSIPMFSYPPWPCKVGGVNYRCGDYDSADAVRAIRVTGPLISEVFPRQIGSATITDGTTYESSDFKSDNKTEDKEYPVGSLDYLFFVFMLILFYRLFCNVKD